MLDIKKIRENPEYYIAETEKKYTTVSLRDVLAVDNERRPLLTEVERLKSERNAQSKRIGELKKKGENADEAQAATRELGNKIDELDKKLKELDSISRAMRTISDRMTDIIGNNAMKNAQDIGEARVQVALGKAELRDDADEMLKKLEKRSEEIRLSILAHKHSGAARLLNAFPTMIHKEHQEIILTLKNMISGK